MFKKVVLAAAAVSVLVTGFQSNAQAAVSTTVRDHRAKVVVRDHRTKVVVRDHRTKRPNEVVKIMRKKISCQLGVEKLWWKGFKSIRINDCSGPSYGYSAHKDNGIYFAKMSAYTGRMRISYMGFAH